LPINNDINRKKNENNNFNGSIERVGNRFRGLSNGDEYGEHQRERAGEYRCRPEFKCEFDDEYERQFDDERQL